MNMALSRKIFKPSSSRPWERETDTPHPHTLREHNEQEPRTRHQFRSSKESFHASAYCICVYDHRHGRAMVMLVRDKQPSNVLVVVAVQLARVTQVLKQSYGIKQQRRSIMIAHDQIAGWQAHSLDTATLARLRCDTQHLFRLAVCPAFERICSGDACSGMRHTQQLPLTGKPIWYLCILQHNLITGNLRSKQIKFGHLYIHSLHC